MKRRKAIQNIALLSSGVLLLPSCNVESVPLYQNLPLEKEQWQLIKGFINALLPEDELDLNLPETTPNFVLTMINDCYGPADIDKYLTGLMDLQIYIDGTYGKNFVGLEPTDQIRIFEYLDKNENVSMALKYFYLTTKRLTIQHFTGSEYFMVNFRDYEMVPGRYLGCVQIKA